MVEKQMKILTEEKEVLHSVSAAGFISYVVYILGRITVTFIAAGWLISTWGLIWFYAEALLVAVGILFAVRKASMATLVVSVRQALADGRITPDEAWGILREAFFLIINVWSDIVPSNAQMGIYTPEEEEEKKTDSPEPDL